LARSPVQVSPAAFGGRDAS